MKASNAIFFNIFLTLICQFKIAFAVDFGSDTAPTRFSSIIQIHDGDRIAGFASIEDGFALAGSGVTATFDSFFPVSGSIFFDLGTLILNRDIIARNLTYFSTLGNIVGNNHTLELSLNVDRFPDLADSSCSIHGLIASAAQPEDVQSLDWSYDDQFIVIGLGGSAPATPIKIYEFDGTLVQRVADSLDEAEEIYVVRWHPSEYFFALGRPSIAGVEAEFRIFEFDPDLNTITETDSINFEDDVYALDWHPSGNYIAVGVADTAAEVQVYAVDAGGVLSASPVVSLDLSPSRFVREEAMEWNADGSYLLIGTKFVAGADTVEAYEFSATNSTLTKNGGFTVGDSTNCISWNKTYTGYIAAGMNGGRERLYILRHDEDAGTISLAMPFGNDSGPSPAVYSVDWGPCGFCLSVGWEESSSSDKIEEFQTFIFDPTIPSLTPVSSVNYKREVEAIRWSHSGGEIAVGGDTNVLGVYGAGCNIEQQMKQCVTFSDLNIYINNDIVFHDCCITFTGVNRLYGNDHCVSFYPSSTVRIGPNSSLLFEDVSIGVLPGCALYCTDDSSTISFDNAELVLSKDFTFTVGRFDVFDGFEVRGEDFTFAYCSSATSVIRSEGCFTLGNNVTFSYNPPTSSNSLLVFEDDTSELLLKGATLHVTSTGLQLTKGILGFDRYSSIVSEATVDAEAIVLGDGVSASNNVKIEGWPAGIAEIAQGIVIVDNV